MKANMDDPAAASLNPVAEDFARGDQTLGGSLEDCVLYVSAALDRPLTRATLRDSETGIQTEHSVADAIRACQSVDLLTWFGQSELADFDASLLPAILILKNGRAVVLTKAIEGEQAVLIDPALGTHMGQVTTTALLQSYSGYALVVRRDYSTEVKSNEARARKHWFWGTLAANRWTYVQVVLAAIVANVLGLLTSIFTMVVYDRILPNEAIDSLIALTAGVGIALLFDFLIKILRAAFVDQAGKNADRVIGRRIFDQLLDLPMQARRGSTGALANVLREFETVRDFFTSATLIAIVDLPFVILYIGVVYMVGGPLALVPAVAVPFVLLIGIAVQPALSRLAENNLYAGQSKQSVLVETVSGLETIKTAGAAKLMRARWEDAVNRQAEHSLRSRAITQFALNATAFAQQAGQVLIVFYGVFLVRDGLVSMGALIAAVILTGRAMAPLAQIAQTLTRLNQVRSAYRSLDALMREESERPHEKRWLQRPKIYGMIEFEDVSFTYPDQSNEVLKNISFKIEPGEHVAILGRIGSGKSTLIRLMLGLYRPTEGAILLDGTNIRQIDPGDLRRAVSAALQEPWLFSGTILQNIAVGTDRPLDQDIVKASQDAGVSGFLDQHPDGFDRMVNERGEGLSGGQRQAIALARTLIGDPPVLVFDEPTSSMDVQTEQGVIERLKSATKGKTLMIVTHRPSLLALVDRVIIIEDGRVMADGPKSILSKQTIPAASVKGVDRGA
jgi:ATP-binding cassette subfamily C protein LapB